MPTDIDDEVFTRKTPLHNGRHLGQQLSLVRRDNSSLQLSASEAAKVAAFRTARVQSAERPRTIKEVANHKVGIILC